VDLQEKQYRISLIVYGIGDGGFAIEGFASGWCWQPARKMEAVKKGN
jgi:hypothetical protein